MVCLQLLAYAVLAFSVHVLASLQAEYCTKGVAAELQQAISAGCPSPNSFCSGILAPGTAYTRSTSQYYASTKTTRTYQESLTTKYKTIYTATLSTPMTLTSVVGQSTTTVSSCYPTATCGAFTHTPNGFLSVACNCMLGTVTTTSTGTVVRKTYVYKYQSTTTSTAKSVFTTTAYAIKTKVVPTKTVYDCSTAAPPQQTCNNEYHQYAVYNLTNQDLNRKPENWNLDYYKGVTPYEKGTAPQIGLLAYDSYGRSEGISDITARYCGNTYINDRAYLYAPQSGQYTFRIPAHMDYVYLWIGKYAYRGYNTSNAFLSAISQREENQGGPFNRMYLQQGRYYPIRFAYRCDGPTYNTAFTLFIQITKPDGGIMYGQYSTKNNYFENSLYDYHGSNANDDYYYYYYYDDYRIFGVNSSYIVHAGCGADKKLAPPFPAWGNET